MDREALQIALMGPDARLMQRNFGNKQMLEGGSGAPVQHWMQGVHRVAQGVVGGLRERDVRQQEEAAARMKKEALAKALAGGSLSESASMLMGNPATSDLGMQLAQSAISSRQQQANAAASQQAKLDAENREFERKKELIKLRHGLENRGTGAAPVSNTGYGAVGIDADGKLILTGGGSSGAVGQSAGDFLNPRLNFGQAGVRSEEVPGVVVSPKGVAQPFATREKQAQDFVTNASLEDQERLHRQVAIQKFWNNTHGKPPSGMIWGPDGTLVEVRQKAPIDLRAALPRAKQALASLDQAENVLKSSASIATRGPRIYFNQGETGQAVQDIKQSALQIVYLLSGKQTSFAEMKNFMEAYVPEALDTDWRITQKVDRVRKMLQGIVNGVESGQTYEEAFANARTSLFEPSEDKEKKRLYDKYGLQ